MKILEHVELIKSDDSPNDELPMKFKIHGGLFDGIEFSIDKINAETEDISIDFTVDDSDALLNAAFEMMKIIIEQDFTARIQQSLSKFEQETDVENS